MFLLISLLWNVLHTTATVIFPKTNHIVFLSHLGSPSCTHCPFPLLSLLACGLQLLEHAQLFLLPGLSGLPSSANIPSKSPPTPTLDRIPRVKMPFSCLLNAFLTLPNPGAVSSLPPGSSMAAAQQASVMGWIPKLEWHTGPPARIQQPSNLQGSLQCLAMGIKASDKQWRPQRAQSDPDWVLKLKKSAHRVAYGLHSPAVLVLLFPQKLQNQVYCSRWEQKAWFLPHIFFFFFFFETGIHVA